MKQTFTQFNIQIYKNVIQDMSPHNVPNVTHLSFHRQIFFLRGMETPCRIYLLEQHRRYFVKCRTSRIWLHLRCNSLLFIVKTARIGTINTSRGHFVKLSVNIMFYRCSIRKYRQYSMKQRIITSVASKTAAINQFVFCSSVLCVTCVVPFVTCVMPFVTCDTLFAMITHGNPDKGWFIFACVKYKNVLSENK